MRATSTASALTAASTGPSRCPRAQDASKANAEFRNGVLEVSVPAPAPLQEQKARRLEVKEGK